MPGEVSSIHIVTCQSIEREMRRVADESPARYNIKVFSSLCHRDPEALGNMIDIYIQGNREKSFFFLGYGNCFRSCLAGMRDVYSLPAMNCSAILLGGNSHYLQLAQGSYFLTPYLALNWKQYFLGNDCSFVDNRTSSKLVKWFKPIERLILIDMETETLITEYESARSLATLIRKPLLRAPGDLDFLRNHYKLFLKKNKN